MNFDRQKFFIGLRHFFSILLPGALLTYLLIGKVGSAITISLEQIGPSS